jgi:tRNA pseudouridine55 synthase
MTEESFKNGQVLLIDKPLEWTSFQVVNKLRWHIKQRFTLKNIKVGHAGTLDPLASGLLILCTGNETKNIDSYQAQIKEYIGIFTIGATTPSYDLETSIDKTFGISHITPHLIEETTKQFKGVIQQKPPIFSAIKHEGKRLYEIARKGETAEIKSREITIFDFEITKIDLPNLHFRVVCSKGTYIRSLAFDFGKALNSGAHLTALRRTKIGDFSVENAFSVESFIQKLTAE